MNYQHSLTLGNCHELKQWTILLQAEGIIFERNFKCFEFKIVFQVVYVRGHESQNIYWETILIHPYKTTVPLYFYIKLYI